MKNDDTLQARQIKHLKLAVIILTALLVIGGLGGGICVYKLYNKIKNTDSSFASINQNISDINNRLDEINPKLDEESQTFLDNCVDENYNILFVGNSITRHPLASYWWSKNRGMAATSLDKDYVHQTEKMLSKKSVGGSLMVMLSLIMDGNHNLMTAKKRILCLTNISRMESILTA